MDRNDLLLNLSLDSLSALLVLDDVSSAENLYDNLYRWSNRLHCVLDYFLMMKVKLGARKFQLIMG